VGIIALNGYVLILRGNGILKFLDGISTNLVEGNCTTVFTTSIAKIIDMVEIIVMGEMVALVGHGPFKNQIVTHLSKRILGSNITIADASASNQIMLSTLDLVLDDSVTKIKTFRGWLLVGPKEKCPDVTMTNDEFNQYRVDNILPHQGHEITPNVHPLACGLGHLVHENKGCYIGQEILARMRSRGRQGKRLSRVENPAEDATTIGETHSLVLRK
jgi:folate-binding protein YgfZ